MKIKMTGKNKDGILRLCPSKRWTMLKSNATSGIYIYLYSFELIFYYFFPCTIFFKGLKKLYKLDMSTFFFRFYYTEKNDTFLW